MANTLSILASSGVPLVDAMSIASQVTTNVPIGNAVRTATTAVREGASLNRALDQSGFFPPLMIQMIASGESSGELDTMLSRAAVAQERELDNMITTIIGLFEPLMLVFMGVIVLTIVLAIMMPVFKMSELAG
ncbi:MAG: type II secretion system F family protein [Gammaproteobacteria bacterium]